ncbi:MAG: NUDIX hydrolase [Mycobacteriales bacterium]
MAPVPSPPRRALRRVDETSAGGLVLDRRGPDARGALIGRLDRRGRMLWSLPKGHVEAGETEPMTAVREVQEETGIRGEVLGKLGTIDFWFVAEGRRVHKTVHHFLLLAVDPETGLELSDEDVEVSEVAWVPLTEVGAKLAYADERRLLEKVPLLLAQTA